MRVLVEIRDWSATATALHCTIVWGGPGTFGRQPVTVPVDLATVSKAALGTAARSAIAAKIAEHSGVAVGDLEMIPFTASELLSPELRYDYLTSLPDSAPLADYKTAKLVALKQGVTGYLAGYLSPELQRTLLSFYTNAQNKGLVNRAAHIEPTATWIESTVLADYDGRIDAVGLAGDHAAVDLVSLDFTNNDASAPSPMPTIKSTLAITT